MTTADDIKKAAAGSTEPGALSQAATTDGDILAAIAKLDPANDDHWTKGGEVLMDALNALLPAPITRERLNEVAPNTTRPTPTGFGLANIGGDSGAGGQPPIDNGHVADGATQFSDAEVEASADKRTVEERLDALEADSAFLRKQFGWPTKDA